MTTREKKCIGKALQARERKKRTFLGKPIISEIKMHTINLASVIVLIGVLVNPSNGKLQFIMTTQNVPELELNGHLELTLRLNESCEYI